MMSRPRKFGHLAEASVAFVSLVVTAVGAFALMLPGGQTAESELLRTLVAVKRYHGQVALVPLDSRLQGVRVLEEGPRFTSCEASNQKELLCAINTLAIQLQLREPGLRFFALAPIEAPEASEIPVSVPANPMTRSSSISTSAMKGVREIDHILGNLEEGGEATVRSLYRARTHLLRIAYLAGQTFLLRMAAWLLDVTVVGFAILYMLVTYQGMTKAVHQVESEHSVVWVLRLALLIVMGIILAFVCVASTQDHSTIPLTLSILAAASFLYLWVIRRILRNEHGKKRPLYVFALPLLWGQGFYAVFFGFATYWYLSGAYSVGSNPFVLAKLNVGAVFWGIFFSLLVVMIYRVRARASKPRKIFLSLVIVILGPGAVVISIILNRWVIPDYLYPRNIFYLMDIGPSWPLWVDVIGPRVCFAVPLLVLFIHRIRERQIRVKEIADFLQPREDVRELELDIPFLGQVVLEAGRPPKVVEPEA